MKFRIGFGYDVHQMAEGRELWLGGIQIPYSFGCLGHSDADVLIHAICDALLGAANLRDIGYHFPNTDSRWKGADSKYLLKEVCRIIRENGYEIGNVDASMALEAPKINHHISDMVTVLSACMNIDKNDISIKATTNETLGYVGRKEGANAYAVALIFKP